MKCIYCQQEKDENEFSLEHIIPQSMGGALLDNNFKTKHVCNRCNNLCGLFVDDACLRNWFQLNAKMSAHLINGMFPSYIGMVDILSGDNEVCDMWTYPEGSVVYHFRPREDKFITHVGGNPITRRKGGGKAILALSELVCKNTDKVIKTVESFTCLFAKNDLFAFNFEVKNHDEIFQQFDDDTKVYKEKIESIKDAQTKCTVVFSQRDSARFYCKIALALGYNILGDVFLETDYAKELIKGLGLSQTIRGESRARGSDFLTYKNPTERYLKLGKANTIAIYGLPTGELACTMSIYGNVANILISPDGAKLTKKYFPFEKGRFYVWLPQKNLVAKPISIAEMIAYHLGGYKNDELDKIKFFSDL